MSAESPPEVVSALVIDDEFLSLGLDVDATLGPFKSPDIAAHPAALNLHDSLEAVMSTLRLPSLIAMMQVFEANEHAATMEDLTDRLTRRLLTDYSDFDNKRGDRIKNFPRDRLVVETGKAIARLTSRTLAVPARELRWQGLVMTWGAFEVFARDFTQTLLNREPSLAQQLIAVPESKKIFNVKNLDLTELIDYGFDLSKSLGTFLLERADFSKIETVRFVLLTLFPLDEALRVAVLDPALWLLNQRRHLIVHKRGVVDAKYLKNTGDSLGIGESLAIKPVGVVDAVKTVANTGLRVVEAANRYTSPQQAPPV